MPDMKYLSKVIQLYERFREVKYYSDKEILLWLRPNVVKKMFVVRASASVHLPLSQIDCLLKRVR
ncbi:4972_t:CDS:2 [Cetraspora pellucida]|uniref:4972_t:CDS:1 n=1 Tax=Cetraspora pellucida TaxID=1433469 RepID=A0A9N9H2L0_9GLOM|nr:4972_t:CDS:2 [Cetraspora pellucida]